MRGVWLFGFSLIVLAIASLFSFTSLAWELGSQKHDSYPELVIMFFQFPAACLLVIDAVLIMWLERRSVPAHLSGLWLAAAVKIFGLSAFTALMCGLVPSNQIIENAVQIFTDGYALLGVPVHLLMTFQGWRKRHSKL